MAKNKKEKKEVKKESKLKDNECADCYLRKGKISIMKPQSPDTLVCPVCNAWKNNPEFKETKEQKIQRMEKELAILKHQ